VIVLNWKIKTILQKGGFVITLKKMRKNKSFLSISLTKEHVRRIMRYHDKKLKRAIKKLDIAKMRSWHNSKTIILD